MILSELRDQLRLMIGNPSTTDVTNAYLTKVINRAIAEIADKYRFHSTRSRATFVTVASTAKYQIPSTATTVLGVTILPDSNNLGPLRLRRKDFGWIEENCDLTTTGRPFVYARYKNYMQLWPIPDAVYTVEVMSKVIPVALSADSDTPIIPETWHEGITKKARYIFYDDNGEMQKGINANGAWLNWLQDKPSEIDEEEAADGDFMGVSVVGLPVGRPTTAAYRREFFEVMD